MRRILISIALCVSSLTAYSSNANDLFVSVFAKTKLSDVSQGGDLSELAKSFRSQSFELQDGTIVRMDDYYKTSWTNLKITFLTELNTNFNLLWGIGTGEYGSKYRIDPSILLGFIYNRDLKRGSVFSFRFSQRFGERFIEKPCAASYGTISEQFQPVNCRLAASDLPPDETLRYLVIRDSAESSPSWNFVFVKVF